jgi:hypothetical protein
MILIMLLMILYFKNKNMSILILKIKKKSLILKKQQKNPRNPIYFQFFFQTYLKYFITLCKL